MTRPPVFWNALKVSLVVGCVLNAINQGPALWQGAPMDWPRFALNHAVPFLVSAYSGAKMTVSGS